MKTTIPFHLRVLDSERFRSGDVDTAFLEQFLAEEPAAACRAPKSAVDSRPRHGVA